MPLFSLTLDKLELSHHAQKLSLSVDCSISLECCNNSVEPMNSTQLLELICSGRIWVTRGNGCCIDFTVQCDGKGCDELHMERIIDGLGSYVQDAPLWSLLSLDAKLEFPHVTESRSSVPTFSIHFNCSMYEHTLRHPCSILLSPSADVQAPAGFPRLRLQKIKMIVTFMSSSVHSGKPLKEPEASCETLPADGIPRSGGRTYSLIDDPPGPTSCLLVQQAGLSVCQVPRPFPGTSFGKLICYDYEMLDDYNLLYSINSARSTTGQSFSQSSSLLPSPPDSQEWTKYFAINHATKSDLFNCACRMTDFAIRNLIGGRQVKNQPGIKVLKPQPTQTLSRIAPMIFNPGFREAISQRSRFVPTISHALSISLLRNVQSPTLRRKLLDLTLRSVTGSDNDVKMEVDDTDDQSVSKILETAHSLYKIVEERLWALMQCSLYDPLSARRLSPHNADRSSNYEATEDAMFHSCLISGEETHDTTEHPLRPADGLGTFVADEFDSLLGDRRDERGEEEFEALFDDSPSLGIIIDEFEDLFEEGPSLGIIDEFEDLFEDSQREEAEDPDELEDTFCDGVEAQESEMDIISHNNTESWESKELDEGNQNYFEEHKLLFVENQDMLM